MELREYLNVLRRGWWIMLGSVLVGLAVAASYILLAPKVYQSTAQLFIAITDAAGQNNTGTAYTGALFAQQRVKSYTVLVDSPGVLEPVIAELGLQTSPSALARRISAVNPQSTVLINVSVTDPNPVQAAAIANSVAKHFAAQIQELEKPAGSMASPVKPSLPRPALVNEVPISPKPKLALALGAFFGLLLGVAIVLLRHALDTTVKSEDDLGELSQATILGSVNYDPAARTKPLVALDRNNQRAESFRTIRTNLQYVDIDNPLRSVVITSALPDEGKSTVACNLAIALAQRGHKVLIVEADLRKPRVADYFDVDGEIGLTDVLIGERAFSDVVIHWNRRTLDILPSGAIPPNPSELLGSKPMRRLLEGWYRVYDTVVLDASPLLPVTDAAVLASVVDGVILVARYGKTRREQVEKSVAALKRVNGRLVGTILNYVPVRRSGDGYGYGYGYGYGDDGSDRPSNRARLSYPPTEAESQGGSLPAASTSASRTGAEPADA